MALHLTVDHFQAIRTDAEHTYPHECCGLLLGIKSQTIDDISHIVVELWPTQNAWTVEAAALTESPHTFTSTRRYWIDPKDMLAAQRYAQHHQFDIIGIYHSHPDHPAVPSECDRTLAWSGYSYVIVSVPQGSAQDLLSWSLDNDQQFQPEAVVLTDGD